MGGLNSKQISEIKKGKTDELVITNQRKEVLQKKLYTLTTTKSWNLSNNFLTAISPKISTLTLTYIDLSSNEFTHFPKELCTLPSLTTLNLSFNFITSVPSEIHQLVALTDLNLSFNHISDIHSDIGKLTNLNTLKLANNYLQTVPDSFSKLFNIQLLSLSHNDISTFPKYTWTKLETFHIAFNKISQIPYTFLCQPSLSVIVLSRNNIRVFPPAAPISNPPKSNLREIYVSNNKLTELHANIYNFPKLEILDVKSNDLQQLPFDLFLHCPLIATLELAFNPNYKWAMNMPNTFAQAPLIRAIHLSKDQSSELKKEGVCSDSDNTDTEASPEFHPITRVPSSPRVPSHNTPSPLSVSSTSPTPTPTPGSPATKSPPSTKRDNSLLSVNTNPTTAQTTSIPTPTSRMITTTISTEGLDSPPSLITSSSNKKMVDEQKEVLNKRKPHHKHVKKYVQNKKHCRLVEHDHTIHDQSLTNHAAHLAELMVWSGPDVPNVEEEIKKVLLHMTLIRPGLYLSSKYAAQDRALMIANNITHVLVVGSELHPAFPTEFEYQVVRVRDNAIVDDLSLYFPICQKFIETGRKKGGVLVHCAAGSSRSASCVMAYLMWSEKLTFADARKELKALRPIVKTNFYLQLEFYEGILRTQSRKKPKNLNNESSVPQKPKLARSTSLPDIEALHFKLETKAEIERENEMETDGSNAPSPPPSRPITPRQNLPSLNINLAAISSSPSTTPGSYRKHASNRSARSFMGELNKVALPPLDFDKLQSSSPRNKPISPRSKPSSPRSKPSSPRSRPSSPLTSPLFPVFTDVCVQESVQERESETKSGEDAGPGGADEADDEDEEDEEEEVDAVPDSVIRQASDFEELSEIHQLMRVHSLQDVMMAVDSNKTTGGLPKSNSEKPRRKVGRSKSFLKNAKINLLEVSTD